MSPISPENGQTIAHLFNIDKVQLIVLLAGNETAQSSSAAAKIWYFQSGKTFICHCVHKSNLSAGAWPFHARHEDLNLPAHSWWERWMHVAHSSMANGYLIGDHFSVRQAGEIKRGQLSHQTFNYVAILHVANRIWSEWGLILQVFCFGHCLCIHDRNPLFSWVSSNWDKLILPDAKRHNYVLPKLIIYICLHHMMKSLISGGPTLSKRFILNPTNALDHQPVHQNQGKIAFSSYHQRICFSNTIASQGMASRHRHALIITIVPPQILPNPPETRRLNPLCWPFRIECGINHFYLWCDRDRPISIHITSQSIKIKPCHSPASNPQLCVISTEYQQCPPL